MNSHLQEITQRVEQFNEYDARVRTEFYSYKRKYRTSAERIEPDLMYFSNVAVFGFPVLALLVEHVSKTLFNCVGFAGAAIAVYGVVLQIFWKHQEEIVQAIRSIELEREIRFSVYNNFRTHPAVLQYVQFKPEEEKQILASLHSDRAEQMRKLRDGVVFKQSIRVLLLIAFGTLVWAVS